jgi:hypothetical protein
VSWTPDAIDRLIQQSAEQYRLDPAMFHRQLTVESGLDPNARSPAGALGIAQLMPGTAAALRVDAMNPAQAIPAAANYMRQNLNRFGGDYDKALAAYNWGPGNVSAKGMTALPRETQAYIAKIRNEGGVPTPMTPGAPTQPPAPPLDPNATVALPPLPAQAGATGAPVPPPPGTAGGTLADAFARAARTVRGAGQG